MSGPFKCPARPARAVAALVVGLFLAQCDRVSPDASPPVEEPAAVPIAPPPAPTATPALSRRDLLDAVEQASSVYAAGTPGPGADPLVGRTFAVRLPFACEGPVNPTAEEAPAGLARAIWAEDRRSIQLTLTPGDWTDTALIATAGAAEVWESVEGFWIPRPWLVTDDCPTIRRDPLQGGVTPTPQSVGLAAVFEAGSSRIGRRSGRAYRHTIRAEDDQPLTASPEGYRLMLKGRISRFPDGRAIRCHAAAPDQRPVCVVATQLDTVAFQTVAGQTLGEWKTG